MEDLRALLAAAEIERPVVLLGGSYGGLIALMYASSYPEQVAGMVLLDAVLPDHPTDANWMATTEQLDQVTTSHQAMALTGSEPMIPVTYIASEDVEVGPGIYGREAIQRAIDALRKRQQALVDRFAPGKLIILDVPHFMEPVIPDRIAEEVLEVIEQSNPGVTRRWSASTRGLGHHARRPRLGGHRVAPRDGSVTQARSR